MSFVNLFIFLLVCSGLTAGIVISSLLDPVRLFIESKSRFLGEMVNCPMCTGLWVGLIMACFFQLNLFYGAFMSCFFSWASIKIVDSISKVGEYYMIISEVVEEE